MLGPLTYAVLGDSDACDNDELYKLLNNSARCQYVLDTDSCEGESLINYYHLFYCGFQESYVLASLFTVKAAAL